MDAYKRKCSEREEAIQAGASRQVAALTQQVRHVHKTALSSFWFALQAGCARFSEREEAIKAGASWQVAALTQQVHNSTALHPSVTSVTCGCYKTNPAGLCSHGMHVTRLPASLSNFAIPARVHQCNVGFHAHMQVGDLNRQLKERLRDVEELDRSAKTQLKVRQYPRPRQSA